MEYSHFLQAEQFNHERAGVFHTNSLFTRAAEGLDLLPSVREKAWDAALPFHIHEYIHYLHNISTPPGIIYLFNGFNLFFEFMKGTDRHGIYDPAKNAPEVAKPFLEVYDLLQGKLKGERPPKETKIQHWSFSDPRVQTVQLNIFGHNFDTFSKSSIEVKAVSNYGTLYDFTLEIGIYLITEGIAYEIDREVRRKIGSWPDLDYNTPPYPYLIYQPVIDSLVGRKTSVYERIILGTCALLETAPGKGLIRACAILRSCKETSSREFIQYVINLNQGLRGFQKDLKAEVMPSMIRNFEGSPVLQAGVKEYCNLISASFEKRCSTPLMELDFIYITCHENYFKKIKEHVPQWICQEKPNGVAEISLIGPKKVTDVIDEIALSTLQSAFHYMQLHITSNGRISATQGLPNTRCPFIGACEARSRAKDSETCIRAPWDTAFPERNDMTIPTCFYTHGAKSLFYEQSPDAIKL